MKNKIDSLLSAGEYQQVFFLLVDLIADSPSYGNYVYAENVIGRIEDHFTFPICRIAILRSITLEPIVPFLKVKCFLNRIRSNIYFGPFNVFDQEILNPESDLYSFQPDVVIFALRAEEACPRLVKSFLDLNEDGIKNEVTEVCERIDGLLSSLRSRSKAKVVVHNFEHPAYPALDIIDRQSGKGQLTIFEELNNKLLELTRKYPDVYLLDYDHLVSLQGRKAWFDESMWQLASAPITRAGLEVLAHTYVKYLVPMLGLTKKCVVLDLDNTLWGGIVGEVGCRGIVLGDRPPGRAFQDFQRVLLQLYQKGFLLAINSKNNENDVQEVLTKNSNMLLNGKHFAAKRINWLDKAQNMQDLANELNIGINSFVFFDDNPVERELIRQRYPDITTVPLPKDPRDYARIAREMPDFSLLSLTEEDMKRGEMYFAQTQRKILEESCASLSAFYKSLEMESTIYCNDRQAISRIAQMTQKTNQFNMTTRRYSEGDIAGFFENGDYRFYTLHLKDKFGDNGLVGLLIVKDHDGAWEIDTFLLSCRIIGRTAETTFLAYLLDEAKNHGIPRIVGAYIPTKKNGLVKDIYKDHGFTLVKDAGGTTTWELPTEGATIEPEGYISLVPGVRE